MMKPLTIEEANGVGDNLKAEIDCEGMISIEVEEPWAGDTMSGFGRSGAIRLTKDEALRLSEWLRAAALAPPP